MTADPTHGRDLLDYAYRVIEARRDDLVDTAAAPGDDRQSEIRGRWTEIGDWLALGHRLGAEKVLFLRNEPVFVFQELVSDDDALLRLAYGRAWSMSGPFCLFVALPTELRVYALTDPPPAMGQGERLSPLAVVRRVAEVEALLRGGPDPDDPDGALGMMQELPNLVRADVRLVRELGVIRRRLMGPRVGLRREQAHALIGRSILIRYLEDRGVITREYFQRVAGADDARLALLDHEEAAPDLAPGRKRRFYDRVLTDVAFATDLFTALAEDFNGDLFSLGSGLLDELEPKRLADALGLLRRLLLGDVDEGRPRLFVWAYDFEVVPISLISSIYEEFHHSGQDEESMDVSARRKLDDNTHYTPWTLVHDVLSRMLTDKVLDTYPRVLDPACGSGIFLVESYRRIVRHRAAHLGRRLRPDELRRVMREQIAGIEVDPEAARVAAFSLHLAMLDQQTPPDILNSGRLPNLVHDGERDDRRFGTIVIANAFDLTRMERKILEGRLVSSPRFAGRAVVARLLSEAGELDVELGGFDVIVGNPPWQEISLADKDDADVRHGAVAVRWATAFGHPVGENSYSQLFLHRSLTLMAPGGRCGLLVSIKSFWNSREPSKAFRVAFLAEARIHEVMNYVHVRHVFFTEAVAPFAFVHFGRREASAPNPIVVYWSARRTPILRRFRSMALARVDRRMVAQRDLAAADHLWKTYWWGNHHDAALLNRLLQESTLNRLLDSREPRSGYGWQIGSKRPSARVAALPELVSGPVRPFGPLRNEWFVPAPSGVKRDPDPAIYEGPRLVATRGVKEPFGPVVRYEELPFTFRHTILSVPLPGLNVLEAQVILGTAWSSLARYRLFMTSGGWGGWSDQVTKEDFLSMPVRLSPGFGMTPGEHLDAVGRIVRAVDFLRAGKPAHIRETDQDDVRRAGSWASDALAMLDDAVFDLFDLSTQERDLVRDFWAYSHDLYWHSTTSTATLPVTLGTRHRGRADDLGLAERGETGIGPYLRAFLAFWNTKVEPGTEFEWSVASGNDDRVLAATFELVERTGAMPDGNPGDEREWQVALARCGLDAGGVASPMLLAERVVRVVTDRYFVVLRRNERRGWSASTAREDAEAILVRAMRLPPVSR